MIENKETLQEYLKYESKIYNRKNIRIPIFCVTENDFLWKHQVLLRKTEYYTNSNRNIKGLFYKILLKRFQNNNQLHIPINTFNKGFKILHLGPILVNGEVKAGEDVALHMNT